MKAFLINPADRTITAVDYDGKTESLYALLECQTFDRVALAPTVDMWVDDEGHFQKGNPIFTIHQVEAYFAGRAVVLGHDGEGNSIAPAISLDRLLRAVRWTELAASGDFTEGHTKGNVIYGGQPIPELREGERYVIWSNEHAAYWGPGSCGYTRSLKEAGRYSRQHAVQVCFDARGGWNGSGPPPEIPVRERDAIAAGLEGKYPQ